ncbi:MAG: transcriptional regulator [Gemmatimonadales bacterium]|nr:transcriptional regulator [Gemmatimonadales bacterium]
MSTHLVVTAAGRDRPGIVQRVTEVLVAHGANVEEARMARLGGEFAAILLVAVPQPRVTGLNAGLASLERDDLHVLTRPTTKAADLFQGYVPFEVHLSGADHQGILHRVSDFLAGQGINIESLDTEVTNAPVTGVALFSMHALVQAPPDVSFGELRTRLREIADRLGVDIEVKFA